MDINGCAECAWKLVGIQLHFGLEDISRVGGQGGGDAGNDPAGEVD